MSSASPLDRPHAPPSLWREGREVVLASHRELPRRCIRCNGPAVAQKRISLSGRERSPLQLVGFLLPWFAALALGANRHRVIHVSYCARHRRRRRLAHAANAIAVLGGGALVFALPFEHAGWMPLGLLAAVAGMFNVARMTTAGVRPTFQNDDFVRLRGLGRPFVESIS